MNSSNIKDESFLNLNHEELKIKRGRKASNVNVRNTFKTTAILKKPIKVSNSISKFRLKKLNIIQSIKPEGNSIIKDYLHSHKFGIQRKVSKKITVKVLKTNINKSLLSNKNINECASMVYYPSSDKTKNIKFKEDIKIEKDKKPNLKKIEDLLKNKLNNMKFNFQSESIEDEISNYYNIRDNNKSVRIYKNKKISNSHLNNNYKRGYTNHVIYNSKKNSNLNKSSNFTSQNANTKTNSSFMNNLNKTSNDNKRISFENITKDNLKLTDLDNNRIRKKKRFSTEEYSYGKGKKFISN
jgi:hypothetical protein